MKNQVLSIEQMQHLQELGVDTSKASCYWWYAEGKNYLYWGKCSDINGIPTFTLQDMLYVIRENCDDNRIDINITTRFFQTWKIYVEIYKKHFESNQVEIFEHQDLSPCLYDAFCWLAENGYLKGGNNEKRD